MNVELLVPEVISYKCLKLIVMSFEL